MVSSFSIVLMVLCAFLGVAVPIALAWWLVRKYKVRWSVILAGAAAFFIAALVLESAVHQLVLNGPGGNAILGNTIYYALYGGLMAGLFEETARFLVMKYYLKKRVPDTVLPGVAYGVGHGGAEMLIIFGIGMVSSIVMALMVNAGQTEALIAKTPEASQAALQAQIDQLVGTKPGALLIGIWERIAAIVLQIAQSVLVWTGVRKGGKWIWLFPLAILLHAVIDAGAVLLSKSAGMVPIELIVTAEAVAVAALAWLVARKACQCPAPEGH